MPESRFLKKWAQPILVPAVVLVAVVVILALVAQQFQGLQDRVRHTTDVKGRLTLVYSLLQEAEAGVRGFILTQDEFYLSSLTEAERRLKPELDALTDLLSDNAVQSESLTSLRVNVDTHLVQMEALVRAARAGDQAGIVEEMRRRTGVDLIQGARTIVDAMTAEEDRLLVARRAKANLTAGVLQLLAYGTLFLVMTVAVLSLAAVARRREYLEEVEADLRAANNKLSAEMLRREKAEEQLRQVQKMEAIGQLTGGIAHDFNNMLAVIMGALNIMQRRIDRGDFNIQPFMQAAIEGAQRGGALTQRMLAFARKQVLEPRPLDANKLVSGMSDLLRRTLGEVIQTEVVLAGGLWRTHADAHQLETAILNLVVNARDAMPQGGKLTLETANAHLDDAYVAEHGDGAAAGQYVMISVTDTGAGMPPEVISRAFDPFFTTKEPGKGTGLGLSQVYGFVKQSGGHIKIYSEVGQGTTFKIYLSRYEGADDIDTVKKVDTAPVRAVPGETVLVVEDDEAVRKLAVEGLSELGYAVLQADNAVQALKLLEEHPAVVLLFTDVVMPNVNGRELADEAQRRWPSLKVLFTTGYTRNAMVHNGTLAPGVRLIGKPYTLQQLGSTVRDILDS
ncbi:MAG: CHASE3 domain-containing protein [Proteobacteria bacterium]|nr:CHASE3 domain-containing protein [Pseudomonadota bacterium]